MPIAQEVLARMMAPNIGLTRVMQTAGFRSKSGPPGEFDIPRHIGDELFDTASGKFYRNVTGDASGWRELIAGAEEATDFGTFGPALPDIGLPVRWDFDMNYEPLGAMRAEIPTRVGSVDTGAIIHPMSGDLVISALTGTRRALTFDASKSTFARLLEGMTVFQEANADFTIVAVVHRDAAGADHTIFDLFAGLNSGASTEVLQRIRLRWSSANGTGLDRGNGSSTATAALGTPSTSTPNIIVFRGSRSSDQLCRGVMNAGSFASTAVRSITLTTWTNIHLGATAVWSGGTSGFATFTKFLTGKIERLACFEGSGDDTQMGTLRSWAQAFYT